MTAQQAIMGSPLTAGLSLTYSARILSYGGSVFVQVSGTACALGFQPGAPDNTVVLGTSFLRAYFTAYTYNATSRSSYVSLAPAAPGSSTAASELLETSSSSSWHTPGCVSHLRPHNSNTAEKPLRDCDSIC